VSVFSAVCNNTGVNLSGAEWGKIPGTVNVDYVFPTNAEVDYFVTKKINLIRFPIAWERVQPSAKGDLDLTYLGGIQNIIGYATERNVQVLLDVHNYARYYGNVIGESEYGSDVLADLWSKLAREFANNPKVIFGIMNEPNNMKTETWLADANDAIAAIRSAGASNLITVPGNGWTGASSWSSNWYGTPNAEVMLNVKDPANNYIYEVHQYLDSDGSGTHENCTSSSIGSQDLSGFTSWCKTNKKRAILAEFAGGNNDVCKTAINDMIGHMESNPDVYVGWSWWAAGPWWPWPTYIYTVEPTTAGEDSPLISYLYPEHTHGV